MHFSDNRIGYCISLEHSDYTQSVSMHQTLIIALDTAGNELVALVALQTKSRGMNVSVCAFVLLVRGEDASPSTFSTLGLFQVRLLLPSVQNNFACQN